jgi:hypothetical protein
MSQTIYAFVGLCVAGTIYLLCKKDDPRPLVAANKDQFKNSFFKAVKNSTLKQTKYRGIARR